MLYTPIEMRPKDFEYLKESLLQSIYTPIEVNEVMIYQALEANFHHANTKFCSEICQNQTQCDANSIGERIWEKIDTYLQNQITTNSSHTDMIDNVVFALASVMPGGNIHLTVATLISKYLIKKEIQLQPNKLQ
jgi:hypothetical protein